MKIAKKLLENVFNNLSEHNDNTIHYKLSGTKLIRQEISEKQRKLNYIMWFSFIAILLLDAMLDTLNIMSFGVIYIFIGVVYIYLMTTIANIAQEVNERLNTIENHLKSKEIGEITKNNDLSNYYSLNNIESSEGKELLKKINAKKLIENGVWLK